MPAELDMAEHSGIEVRHMSTEEIEGFYRAERYGASIKTFKKDVERGKNASGKTMEERCGQRQ